MVGGRRTVVGEQGKSCPEALGLAVSSVMTIHLGKPFLFLESISSSVKSRVWTN